MRIGIAQLNSTVGDLAGNLALAIDAYEQLVGQGVDLVVYPELMLCGYPPRDLLLKENFGRDCLNSLQEFARNWTNSRADRVSREKRRGCRRTFFQCSRLVHGRIRDPNLPQTTAPDLRCFRRGPLFCSWQFNIDDRVQGKEHCGDHLRGRWNLEEDLYPTDPLDEIASEKPDFLINLSASVVLGQGGLRIELLAGVARKVDCPVVYANSVGGNDELVFDGFSFPQRQWRAHHFLPVLRRSHRGS